MMEDIVLLWLLLMGVMIIFASLSLGGWYLLLISVGVYIVSCVVYLCYKDASHGGKPT